MTSRLSSMKLPIFGVSGRQQSAVFFSVFQKTHPPRDTLPSSPSICLPVVEVVAPITRVPLKVRCGDHTWLSHLIAKGTGERCQLISVLSYSSLLNENLPRLQPVFGHVRTTMFGISEYVCRHRGFTGDIKQHVDDFRVWEIQDGLTLEITNSVIPKALYRSDETGSKRARLNVDGKDTAEHTAPSANDALEEVEAAALDVDFQVSALFSGAVMAAMGALDQQAQNLTPGSDGSDKVDIGPVHCKRVRKALHEKARQLYPRIRLNGTNHPDGQYQMWAEVDPNYKKLCGILPDDVIAKLLVLNFNRGGDPVLLPAEVDKDARTRLHRAVAGTFHLLETKTINDNRGGSRISVRVKPRHVQDPNQAGRKRTQIASGATRDQYLSFVLEKRGLETLHALQLIAEAVGAHQSDFSIAGTKDKAAVTTQRVHVRNVAPEALDKAVNKKGGSDRPNMRVGNYAYVKQALSLGDLGGNRFRVVVRNIQLDFASPSQESVAEAVTMATHCVRQAGFVNYFGPQRFGGPGEGGGHSVDIGRAMLVGDFKGAVQLALEPDPRLDTGAALEAKTYLKATGDYSGALERMPRHKTRECLLLKALKRHAHGADPDDQGPFIKALLNLPYTTRTLCAAAYQSLVFNHAVSRRIQLYGVTAVTPGDLVEVPEGANGEPNVRHVTPYDVAAGHSVLYPTNGVADVYREMLAADLGSASSGDAAEASACDVMAMVGKRFRVPELGMSLGGAYRKMVARADDLAVEMLETPPDTGAGERPQAHSEASGGIAAAFAFTLPPSSYATVCLQEVMQTRKLQEV